MVTQIKQEEYSAKQAYTKRYTIIYVATLFPRCNDVGKHLERLLYLTW